MRHCGAAPATRVLLTLISPGIHSTHAAPLISRSQPAPLSKMAHAKQTRSALAVASALEWQVGASSSRMPCLASLHRCIIWRSTHMFQVKCIYMKQLKSVIFFGCTLLIDICGVSGDCCRARGQALSASFWTLYGRSASRPRRRCTTLWRASSQFANIHTCLSIQVALRR